MPCAAGELCQIPEKTPEPPTDTDVTEGVVVDSTAFAAKSSKRMTANSDVAYGKGRATGKAPAVDGLMNTLNTVSVRVHDAQEELSPVTDTEIIEFLANLNITRWGHADESAKQKAQECAIIENQEDFVEAMKSDAADDRTNTLASIHMKEEKSSDSKGDGSDYGSTGGGGFEPPLYADLSQHFGTLKKYASGCGLTEASYFLKQARMVMMKPHASKPARWADVREFVFTREMGLWFWAS